MAIRFGGTVRGPESIFLEGLFAALKQSGITYAVMRNYTHLPFSAGGSDLDILISTADGLRVKKIILDAISAAHGVPLGISETVGFFKIYSLGKGTSDTGLWWGLRLDINTGLVFRGYPLLAENADLPLKTHRDIQVLADGFSGVLGVLKEVLHNNTVPSRYLESAQRAAQLEWSQMETLLAPMGPSALQKFQAILLAVDSLSPLRPACSQVRRALLWHVFLQQPFHFLKRRLVYEWSKVRRYLKPSGIVVAILGVDGAGKSTVIEAVLPALNAATHNAVCVRHLRPGLLPPLARLKGKKTAPAGPVVDPHGQAPSNTLGSLLRLSYLLLDYFLGYWLLTRPMIAKMPTIVLFDRYAYDMALDPRRFRIGLPTKIINWFVKWVPQPDLVICLQGNVTTVNARKKEVPLEETKRQMEALRIFAGHRPQAFLISTDRSIEETRDSVLSTIFNFLQSRANRWTNDKQ